MVEALIALGGIATAASTYLLGRRKASGRVSMTEADKLWKEAYFMRRDSRRRELGLEKQMLRLRIENHSLRNQLLKLEFALVPEVPEEIKLALIETSESHIAELRLELERRELEEKEINGGPHG